MESNQVRSFLKFCFDALDMTTHRMFRSAFCCRRPVAALLLLLSRQLLALHAEESHD